VRHRALTAIRPVTQEELCNCTRARGTTKAGKFHPIPNQLIEMTRFTSRCGAANCPSQVILIKNASRIAKYTNAHIAQERSGFLTFRQDLPAIARRRRFLQASRIALRVMASS
jgi:hypothetical protein